MQVCISLQTDNHVSTPPLKFLQVQLYSFLPLNQQRQSTEGNIFAILKEVQKFKQWVTTPRTEIGTIQQTRKDAEAGI